ncbi:type III-B CRISPR module-associated protein Cmr5 [Thauera sp. JM12B12]|uniref:type III-B CRISPR module-associated protein Cmr5 n=1 Tax=Thauera sp. JM12B12 TaxID=3142262 RepID=UPI0031F4188D
MSTPAKSTKSAPVTLEQKRAQYAWQYAESGIGVSGDKYRNLAKAAPALIMNNGLMQTLAFLNSKNERHHQALAEHIRRWLSVRGGGPDRDVGFEAGMKAMLDFAPDQYRQATDEALLILRWIRQFAAAL